jgi:hypothetical protein
MKTQLVDAFSTINLVSAGALVGIVLSELVIILPLVRRLPAADGVSGLRFAGFRAWRFAPYLGAIAWLSGIVMLAIWPWHSVSTAAASVVVGVAFWTLAVVVTFAWYFPVDASIRGLSVDAAHSEAAPRFRRLAQFHALRTAFYTAGFVCFALGAALT